MIWLVACLRGKPGEAARTSVWNLGKCPGQRLKLSSSLEHHTEWPWASDIPSLGFSYKTKQNNKETGKPNGLVPFEYTGSLFIVKKCPSLSYGIRCTFNHELIQKTLWIQKCFQVNLCCVIHLWIAVCVQVTLVLITSTSVNTWKICVRKFVWLACDNDHSQNVYKTFYMPGTVLSAYCILCNPYKYLLREIQLRCPFYRWETWGMELLSSLPGSRASYSSEWENWNLAEHSGFRAHGLNLYVILIF